MADLGERFFDYARLCDALIREAKALGLRDVLGELAQVWLRLRQGPIRALVLGATSAGKSTLLNAVAGALVAPEGVLPTSPVPVWIGAGETRQMGVPYVNLIVREAGDVARAQVGSPASYLTSFCYPPRAAGDRERQKLYEKYEAAEIAADCGFLRESGITLIDTPGIGTESCDALRTEESISRGAEMLIFVDANPNMLEPEADFLRSLLLGDAPRLRLDTQRSLFIVHNPRDVAGGAGSEGGFLASVLSALGEGSGAKVFTLNARDARLKSAGCYSYTDKLPIGASAEDRQWAQKAYRAEIRRLKMLEGEAPGAICELLEALTARAKEIRETPDALLSPIRAALEKAAGRLLQARMAQIAAAAAAPDPHDLAAKARAAQFAADSAPLLKAADDLNGYVTRVMRRVYEADSQNARYKIYIRSMPDAAPDEKSYLVASSEWLAARLSDAARPDIVPSLLSGFEAYAQEVWAALEPLVEAEEARFDRIAEEARLLYARTLGDAREGERLTDAIARARARGRAALDAGPACALIAEKARPYLEKKRAVLADRRTAAARFRAGWEKLGLSGTVYRALFSQPLQDLLRAAVRAEYERRYIPCIQALGASNARVLARAEETRLEEARRRAAAREAQIEEVRARYDRWMEWARDTPQGVRE